MPSISVVAPIHNEYLNIRPFYERLKDTLDQTGCRYEIILVDDGSNDDSFNEIRLIADSDNRVQGIKLSRNFGHQNAVTCGLHAATGDAVVIIDADLQDPPELILELFEQWQLGFKNVYAQRVSRDGESAFKKFSAKIFYKVLASVSDYPIPVNTGDFRLIDRKLLNILKEMKEENRFLRGMVAWLGFSTIAVPYHRAARVSGETKYTLRKMIKFAQNGIFAFSSKPLKFSSYLGLIGLFFTTSYGLFLIVEKAFFPQNSAPGYSSIMLGITSFGSLQLLSIGLLGEYLQRIYIEIKGRPLYIIDETTRKQRKGK